MVDNAIIIEANAEQENKDRSVLEEVESIQENNDALMSNFSTYEKQLRKEQYDNERYGNSKS